MFNEDNMLDSAKSYIDLGWSIVPIPHRSKKPDISEWQKLEITAENVGRYFNGQPQNIGVLLGKRSDGLVDIDLDSPEAVKLADHFLPETSAIFGRTDKPSSHRLYFCPDATYKKFYNPLMLASTDANESKNACIVEIRTSANGKGIQTVFPPSVHESGQAISWVKNGEPANIAFIDLERAVNRLAAASLLPKYWREGIRHDLTLAVAGTLLRHGIKEADVKHFIKAVCITANDNELTDRMRAIEDTAVANTKGNNTFGIPKFTELTDPKIANSFCGWVGIQDEYKPANPSYMAEEPFKAVCMLDVKAKDVEWLWKPFIPVGEFTILEGIEGLGKSWIGCALACAVASGADLPFHKGEPLVPAKVLLLSAEDSLSHTVRPRLDSMEANLERIFAIDAVFCLNDKFDLICFEAEIAKWRPKLVFIDPMFSFTGGKDLNAESSSRPIARKLIELAQKYNCAIIGVRHVGKSKGQGDPRNAGLGSISWRASARSVLLVGQDPDTGERAICQTKNNLTEPTSIAVSFDIVDGKFSFGGKPSTLTKERMLAPANDPESRAEQTEAIEFLLETLTPGPQLSKEVEKEAKTLGITTYAFRRARAALSVIPFKKGGTFGGDKKWYMKLPGLAEVVDIQEFQHLQNNQTNNASCDSSLAEDVEILPCQQDQRSLPTSSNGSNGIERSKAMCGCGQFGNVGYNCRNCGETILGDHYGANRSK